MSDLPPPPPGFAIIEAPASRRRRSPDAPPPPPGFEVTATPTTSARPPAATGDVHDGDTFRLTSGLNARLFGVDAFELNQTGRAPDGSAVPLGQQARSALLPFAKPPAEVSPIGGMTYGRPVVSLENGGDAGRAILDQGYGLATPEYLKADPERLTQYMTAERGARLNHRGAFKAQFQSPSDFRHGGAEPWAQAEWSDKPTKDGQVVFWDEPTPFQGLRPEIEAGYVKLTDDPTSTPADALAYAKNNGFELDPRDVMKFYAARAKGAKPSGGMTYRDKPRVLTNMGDGKLGVAVRGFGDPLNLLDEGGAIVDTFGGTGGRESVLNSDRRLADIYANNLEQNRSILASDEARHPYIRLGGQLAGGLAIPGASIEGVGLAAGRKILQAGGTRFAAEAAAKAAVRARFIAAGSIEGAVMGAGGGETWGERGTGALIGSGVGATLAGGMVVGGQTGGKYARSFLDARRAGRTAASLDPETGAFGPIHYDLADNYPAALERMRKDGTGEVPAAIKHPDIGPIDLIWGDGSYGLSKIAAKHPEVLDDLPAIVERLPVKSTPDEVGNARYVLEDATHRAVVASDFDGEAKRWLVTSFEKKNAPGDQTTRRDPLLPDGGSTGSGASADIAPAGAGSNILPGTARPAADADPLVSPPATAARPLPADRFRGPLSAHTPTLYREMSFGGDGFGRLTMPSELAGRWRNEGGTDTLQFADTPTLATGQGSNKGFVFEYDSTPFIGAPRLEKPGAPLAWQNGAGEYSTNNVTQETLQAALRGFRVKPGAREALPVAERQLFDNIAADLERKGWQRSEAADGSTVYRRPDAVPPSRQRDRIDINDRAVPMLDDATEAQRRAQAERIDPRDVLPVPSSSVASVEEAVAASAGRYPPVRAPNERNALASRSIPSPNDGLRSIPKRGPLDLVTWLRMQGGLRPQGGELQHYGIDNAERAGMDFAGGEKRFGRLVDAENGMPYDEAADAAWKAGYFPDNAERPTVSEFLDALSATHSGRNRSFLTEDHAEVDAFEAQRSLRHSVEGARERGAPLVEDRGQPVDMADLDRNAPPVTAYEEWGENAPKMAGNLRLENLDSPQAIKRALTMTHAKVGGFAAATRGRITRAETESLAGELGMTPDDLLKRRKGQALNAEQALAARQILAKSANELVNLARKVAAHDAPGDEATAAFRQAWTRHVAIQEQVAGATAEAGRALAQFRITANSRAASGDVLKVLAEGSQGADRIKQAAELIVENAADPGSLNRAAARAMKPRFSDKLVELYYNSILSGPATHAVNITSNTMTALSQIPEHALAAVIGAPRAMAASATRNDRVLFSELGARAVGLLQGAKEGLVQAARTLRTGEASDFVSKVESHTSRAISGVKGSLIRTPTRALSAEDELFKAMARRMELSGLAVRQAKSEGLAGAAAKSRAAELVANPTDAMLAKSFDYGRYLTFQRPLGPMGQSVSRMTQTAPILKLVLPFVRTPTNILKFSLERSPAAPLLKEWRMDFLAGGARRDLAVARVLVGSGTMAAAMEMVANGHLTGGGPAEDSAKGIMRADGWQPYSFKIGDKFYSYQRLDPFATTLGVAADFADLQSHMTDKQRDQVAGLLVASTIKNLSSKTWFSGVSDLSEAVGDPERFGASYLRQRAASIAVPAIVAQTARAMDPTLREAKTVLDAVRARLPGLSSALRHKLDIWGRPIVGEGGAGPDIVSPVRQSTAKNDPVTVAVLASGATISPPGKKIGKRELTDAEYHQYASVAGQLAHKRLSTLVSTGTFAKLPATDRADLIDEVVRRARKSAREQLFAGPAGAVSPGAGSLPPPPPPPPGFNLVP